LARPRTPKAAGTGSRPAGPPALNLLRQIEGLQSANRDLEQKLCEAESRREAVTLELRAAAQEERQHFSSLQSHMRDLESEVRSLRGQLPSGAASADSCLGAPCFKPLPARYTSQGSTRAPTGEPNLMSSFARTSSRVDVVEEDRSFTTGRSEALARHLGIEAPWKAAAEIGCSGRAIQQGCVSPRPRTAPSASCGCTTLAPIPGVERPRPLSAVANSIAARRAASNKATTAAAAAARPPSPPPPAFRPAVSASSVASETYSEVLAVSADVIGAEIEIAAASDDPVFRLDLHTPMASVPRPAPRSAAVTGPSADNDDGLPSVRRTSRPSSRTGPRLRGASAREPAPKVREVPFDHIGEDYRKVLAEMRRRIRTERLNCDKRLIGIIYGPEPPGRTFEEEFFFSRVPSTRAPR